MLAAVSCTRRKLCRFRCASPSGCEEAGWKAFHDFMVMFWSTEICSAAEGAPQEGDGPSTPDHESTMDTSFAPEEPWTRVMQLDEAQQLLSTRLYPAFASLVKEPSKTAAKRAYDMGSGIISIDGDRRNMMVGMLQALHSVFEDLKLDQVLWRHIPSLAALLAALSGSVNLTSWKVRAQCFPQSLRQTQKIVMNIRNFSIYAGTTVRAPW